jgi:23S rRNA (guanosine2251-2'-O)-methyltransferase
LRTHHPGPPGAPRSDGKDRIRRRPTIDRLYGRNAVRESLTAGRRRFVRLLIADNNDPSQRLNEVELLARSRGIPVERVVRDKLDSIVNGHHQGVVLEAGEFPYASDYDLMKLASTRSIVLALDGLVDPQNVGSLLRTAEATGVGLVVIPTDRSAHISPAVVNSSSGAVEHLDIAMETNLSRWLDRARDAGFWVVGMAGDEKADPLFDTSMSPPIVLVLGSEGSGLRRLVREHCDIVVSLPMRGKVASLNAAVAGSIGLFEIVRDTGESLIE